MTTTILLCGCGLGATIYALLLKCKLNRTERQLTHSTQRVLDLSREKFSLGCDVRRLKKVMQLGYLNLTWIPYDEIALPPNKGIAIIGNLTLDPKLFFIVKNFEYNPNDPKDKELAIQKAELLIDVIYHT